MPSPVIQRSFAAGELAPVLHARADDVKYATGLKTCRNFIVRREGGVSNRAGLRYVATCATTASPATVQLVRYVSETAGNSILIEAGFGYFRFFRNGGAVTLSAVTAWSGVTAYVPGDIVSLGGVNYYCILAHTNHTPVNPTYWYAMPGTLLQLPSPYGTNGLFNWHQSANVLTLTHALEPPRELICYSLTRWVLQAITTTPSIVPPGGPPSAVAGAVGTLNYAYIITAAALETYEESVGSAVAACALCATPTPAAPNVVSWAAVAGAAEYYVYCDPYGNGTFGFIGTAVGVTSLRDIGFVPDFELTPPLVRNLFAAPNDYPAYSATYQQRRMFAFTNNVPDGIWASRTGFRSNFSISSPLQDADALTFRIAGGNHHPVRNLLALRQLVVLTDGGGWVVGQPGTPLTPSNIPAEQHVYDGVAPVRAVVVGHTIVYVQARQSILRDLNFEAQVFGGFAGRELTIYSSHLFDGHTVSEIDFQEVPHSTIWCVRDDGVLLGLTYIPDQEVWGWHRHDTAQNAAAGVIEHVCCIPEPGQDVVYVIVRRTIAGVTVRYIEKLEKRAIINFNADSFFVDAGLTYSGAPVSSVSGLSHLEGQTVAIVGDGTVVYNGDPAGAGAATYRVSAGVVALGGSYSTVHVGLAIRYADMETLDLDANGTALRDKKKRVNAVTVLVESSARSFWAGPDAGNLRQYTPRNFDTLEQAHTGQCEVSTPSAFNAYGRVLIRQVDPLPLTVLGVIPLVEIGG